MSDQKEPKKETVRITLPPRAVGQPPPTGTGRRDTVRINMPARPPGNGNTLRPPAMPGTLPPRPPLAQSPLPPPPGRSFAPSPSPILAASPSPDLGMSSSSPGPKKETARITLMPGPGPKPTHNVEMKKTQPLITMPELVSRPAPLTVATTSMETVIDTIPMSLCWGLLAASAVTLIIQIWNYIT